MQFVDKLQDDSYKIRLFREFKNAYNKDFGYVLNFGTDKAFLDLYDGEKYVVGYILEDFDLLPMDKDGGAISEKFYGVSNSKSREIYLSFMKNTFPEYRDEYIKNLDNQMNLMIEEIDSL